ncbi:DNA recombination protein RmuC [Curtobacterium sp. PhB142]|uniref:DNA recombination protein RmuC n=1 Tax=unclassified Curtobacterium TaxID=257496 RepID=UPI0010F2BA6C|nr:MULTISPECIES: DNA recombination protein RmuC [unclassified Curtobacterium]TCL83423.1 DNA recombination protein RmuC [Curtobacterium sp. PhB142]TCM00944.1 DNA recombination protein RmuC [Curtobacterium sp. PhB134]
MTVLVTSIAVLVLLVILLQVVVLLRMPPKSEGSQEAVREFVRTELRVSTDAILRDLSGQRTELIDGAGQAAERLDRRLAQDALTRAQEAQAHSLQAIAEHEALVKSLQGLADRAREDAASMAAAHAELKSAVEQRFDELRVSNEARLDRVRDAVETFQAKNAQTLDSNSKRVQELIDSNLARHRELQDRLGSEMEKLRAGNESKLEHMRQTVDEKLQGTLEKRLGESFAQVSDRLERVQQGLGEMKVLASDVGGLKKVLTNVKSRGSWGEVQLARQLEDMLAPEQYEANVAVRRDSQERVEFAVRLPGRDADQPVYLPIDSKLPQDEYERVLAAQDEGDAIATDAATKSLERAIILQAKLISSKYLNPPQTTDFAIMYLATEGLFAEVVRRPGLASRLQNDHRILITGPTTLMSLLNSLQMGFKTLAIEKRTSEVWSVLSAAKTEFQKYGDVWDKLGKQLETAQRTVKDAGVRSRAVERRLRDVSIEQAVDHQVDAAPDLVAAVESAVDGIEFAPTSPIDAETDVPSDH